MAPIHNLMNVTKDCPFMACLVKVNPRSSWQRTVRKVLSKCQVSGIFRRLPSSESWSYAGVYNFRMNQGGEVEISGTVDPSLLLKMLGKAGSKAELRWLQFGECSSNLFMPITRRGYNGGTAYAPDGRYLHSTNLPRPQLPSHDSKSNYQIAYDQYFNAPDYHNYYNQQSNDNKQYYLPAYGHSHDNQHGCDHSHDYNQHAYDHKQDYYQQHGYDHSQDYYQQHGYDLSQDAYGQRQVFDQHHQYRPPTQTPNGEDMGCCRMM